QCRQQPFDLLGAACVETWRNIGSKVFKNCRCLSPRGIRRTASLDQLDNELFEALDRVPACSPWLGRDFGQSLRPRPAPRLAKRTIQRIEITEPEIASQCPMDGGVRWSGSAWHTNKSGQQIGPQLTFRRASENVQTAPNLHLFQLAQISIELLELT